MKIVVITCCLLFSGMLQLCAGETIQEKYKDVFDKIYAKAHADSSAWDRMAYICDTYGPRINGSEGLDRAIEKCVELLRKDGFINVRKEPISVPRWDRGEETLTLIQPHKRKLNLLSLGGSVPTPVGGIESEVFVVHDWSELAPNANKIKNKIVVFDVDFKDYSQHVKYRVFAADSASKYGAVAALVRSVSPYGFQLPHTGIMRYNDEVPKIPLAAITKEESMMFSRIQARGDKAVVHLDMNCKTLEDYDTFNAMGELKGKKYPESIIAVGGHIDSWDIGTCAQDDIGPLLTTWYATKLLKELNLIPNHSVRIVLWGAEETGGQGGQQYAEKHKDEPHVLMLESDGGVFNPNRFGFSGPDSMRTKLTSLIPFYEKIAGKFEIMEHGGGTDIRPMMELGIPGIGVWAENGNLYFREHHSPSDTPDKIDPKIMNDCIVNLAFTIYVYSMEFEGTQIKK